MSIPDFEKRHERHKIALSRGRHPNSFKKDTELWYRVQESNNRLNLIKSGCKSLSSIRVPILKSISINLKTNIKSRQTTNELYGNKPPPISASELDDRKNNGLLDENPYVEYRDIAGVELDIREDLPIKYNGHYVLINLLDEVLCVDKLNDVHCKHSQDVSSSDKFVFVLMHLSDNSADAVKFGDSVWLQLLGSENSMHRKGSVLCSRPWGKLDLTDDFGASANVDIQATSQLDNPKSINVNVNKISSSSLSDTEKKSSTMSNAAGRADIIGHIELMKTGETEKGEQINSRTYSKLSWHTGQWTCRSIDNSNSSKNMNNNHKSKTSLKSSSDAESAAGPNITISNDSSCITSGDQIYLEQGLYCLASARGTKFLGPIPKNTNEIQLRHTGVSMKYKSTQKGMSKLLGLGLDDDDEHARSDDIVIENTQTAESLPSLAAPVTADETINAEAVKDYACVRKICLKSNAQTDELGKSLEGDTLEKQQHIARQIKPNKDNIIDLSTARLCGTKKITYSMDPQCVWRLFPVDVDEIESAMKSGLSAATDRPGQQVSLRSITRASKSLKVSESSRRSRILRLTMKLQQEELSMTMLPSLLKSPPPRSVMTSASVSSEYDDAHSHTSIAGAASADETEGRGKSKSRNQELSAIDRRSLDDTSFSRVLRESFLQKSHASERLAMSPVGVKESHLQDYFECITLNVEEKVLRASTSSSVSRRSKNTSASDTDEGDGSSSTSSVRRRSKSPQATAASAATTAGKYKHTQMIDLDTFVEVMRECEGDDESWDSDTKMGMKQRLTLRQNRKSASRPTAVSGRDSDSDSGEQKGSYEQRCPPVGSRNGWKSAKLLDLENRGGRGRESSKDVSLSDQLLVLHESMTESTIRADSKARAWFAERDAEQKRKLHKEQTHLPNLIIKFVKPGPKLAAAAVVSTADKPSTAPAQISFKAATSTETNAVSTAAATIRSSSASVASSSSSKGSSASTKDGSSDCSSKGLRSRSGSSSKGSSNRTNHFGRHMHNIDLLKVPDYSIASIPATSSSSSSTEPERAIDKIIAKLSEVDQVTEKLLHTASRLAALNKNKSPSPPEFLNQHLLQFSNIVQESTLSSSSNDDDEDGTVNSQLALPLSLASSKKSFKKVNF